MSNKNNTSTVTTQASQTYLKSHKITLAEFGEKCYILSEGTSADTVAALAKEFVEAKADADAVFNYTNKVLELRQRHGKSEDLTAAMDMLQKNAQRLYSRIGKRENSRGKEVPALVFHDERNVQHCEHTADFGVYCMIMQELKDEALKDAMLKFFGSLCEYMGAVLRGDGRRFIEVKSVVAKEMAAKKAENKKRAEKAAETKAKNAEAKAEKEKSEKAKDEKITALEAEIAKAKEEAFTLKQANEAIFNALKEAGMAEKEAQRYSMIAAMAVMKINK